MNKKILISTIIILIIIIGCGVLIVNNASQKQTKLVTRVEYQETDYIPDNNNDIKKLESPVIKEDNLAKINVNNEVIRENDLNTNINNTTQIFVYDEKLYNSIIDARFPDHMYINYNIYIFIHKTLRFEYPEMFTSDKVESSIDYVINYFGGYNNQDHDFSTRRIEFHW